MKKWIMFNVRTFEEDTTGYELLATLITAVSVIALASLTTQITITWEISNSEMRTFGLFAILYLVSNRYLYKGK